MAPETVPEQVQDVDPTGSARQHVTQDAKQGGLRAILQNVKTRALPIPSFGFLRPVRVQPSKIQAPNTCGSNCENKDGPTFPCASDGQSDWNDLRVHFDTSDHVGQDASLEFTHGLHPYKIHTTTTAVIVNGTKVAEVSTKGCEGPTTTVTDSFPIEAEQTTVVFRVLESDSEQYWSWGWFLLGSGSDNPEEPNTGTSLLIGGLPGLSSLRPNLLNRAGNFLPF